MFQLIAPDKLVIGQKYGIVSGEKDYSGIYKEACPQYKVFVKNYDNIRRIHYTCPFYFREQYIYYEFVSDQPQWNMERRAVNLIVRRLLGDDCFEW